MSEGDVSLIRDEDVLRRMWQQTEDFSRKKEIRAHMYRLREERLRSLHSPEPPVSVLAKGVATHGASFADQTFQGLKSKEVRDAGSPPKEFRADLKELSNAGWNVESENRVADDGRTQIRALHADVEGRFDVPGGQGRFTAADSARQTTTEYQDDRSSVRRCEDASRTAAHEEVVRQTADGSHFSSTTSSSSATSKFQQVSSTNEVPYSTDDYDQSRRDISNRNESRQSTNTHEYERNVRRNEIEQGELVERKIDYPDSNTKIIVETRCLPDGTRVTSTRREFRAAAQSSKSEQHSTRSENKSYSSSSHHSKDTRDSSKVTQEHKSSDIVESQKRSDDDDFKRNQMKHTKDDFSQSRQESQFTKSTTSQSSTKIVRESTDQKNIEKQNRTHITNKENIEHSIGNDNLTCQRTEHYNEKDRTENITDNNNVKITNQVYSNDNRASHVTQQDRKADEVDRRETIVPTYTENIERSAKDTLRQQEVEEKVEKKNMYETTYSSDYTQKKISNDWSPTQQAWASSLRSDSPATSRPTTRASSPGTSSLRSSISPDKTYRKYPSRGGSPNKVDRHSPSRFTNDKYSTTDSTQSISETKTYRYSSPDRKPPTRSNRNSSSPERNPDGYRHRVSQSPEKRPYDYRPNTSPDRQPSNSATTYNQYRPSGGTPRPSPSPERQRYTQHRPSPTPPSTSPDRTPGYMKSTEASKHHENTKTVSPDREPASKMSSISTSVENRYDETKYKQEHYKFIDEETKMYSGSEDVTDYCRPESPTLRSSLRKGSRSPSPPKGPVTFTDVQNNQNHGAVITGVTRKNEVEDITKACHLPRPKESPTRESPTTSPSKYGTYDKKQRTDESNQKTSVFSEENYDSVTRSEKTTKSVPMSPTKKVPKDSEPSVKPVGTTRQPSPTKYGTYDKKYRSEETENFKTIESTDTKENFDYLKRDQTSKRKTPENTPISNNKSARDNVSPMKSPIKNTKSDYTHDFITIERQIEERNKTSKNHPRQLITPSSSPTRKPKEDETAPSTGQSSPTTSVSGFVYFSSPKPTQAIITDLDNTEYQSEITETEEFIKTQKRPDSLPMERSSSPSKIPCRSPSPIKRISPVKEVQPRKSSLKKPSSAVNLLSSPEEKPPSSFRVSPTNEICENPDHKVVKKDHPDKPVQTPLKTKYPFERRETYEERCLKILGVVDDVTKKEKSDSNKTSNSVSPCLSPEPKEQTIMKSNVTQKVTNVDVSEFINREIEDTLTKHTTREAVSVDRKSKTPSRESSPTKLKDIISMKTSYDKSSNIETTKEITESPDRDIGYQKPHRSVSPEKKTTQQPIKESTHTRKSPDRKLGCDEPRESLQSRQSASPERKPGYMNSTFASDVKFELRDTNILEDVSTKTSRSSLDRETRYQGPKDQRQSASPERKPGYMNSTFASDVKFELRSTNILEDVSTKTIRSSLDRETGYQGPKDQTIDSETTSKKSKSPERKSPEKKQSNKSPTRSSTSPDKTPGYMKPTASSITKLEETSTTESKSEELSHRTNENLYQHTSQTDSQQTNGSVPERKHSRSPSPAKKVTKAVEDITDFIQTEREQEILSKVQRSLRKLSPNRDQKSPSRERSPGKTTISLEDINVTCTSKIDESITGSIIKEDETVTKTTKIEENKNKDKKNPSKIATRTLSPTKKAYASTPIKAEKGLNPKTSESPNDVSRSVSPKKPASPTGRAQSPQKSSGIKPREPTPTFVKKTSSSNISSTKTDKTVTDTKKVTKQNSFTSTTKSTTSKLTSPNKIEPEPKRSPSSKGINKENVSPKKEDVKVTRTASDVSLKTKKAAPQRMRSKPEIQVNDVSPTRHSKTTTITTTKISVKEPQTKLAPKPKSATSLNTPIDEDDIIVDDVEQAKSSRENSPDRICPTPVGFLEDVGTPRFPDEVSEPDDEFRKRTHHTIHEMESMVDDIVEISEDDETSVNRSEIDRVTGSDECLLSVTDKVSKFTTKIENAKESSAQLKDVERSIHSDYILDEKLKSDECLLSVTEKVNKFAKGPRDTSDRSPSRKITEEYDTETTYQDDYTKLSVNDKAHLFVETADNINAPKTKPSQKPERPDLSNVDESLKSDDCLLSVSDKVSKFVKTAEQFLSESTESKEKEQRVREEYEKFMKQITSEKEDIGIKETKKMLRSETYDVEDRKSPEDKTPSFARETASSHTKVKDYTSPNLKTTDKIPPVKITTLRSSEAVKKAKAMFENIASSQKTTDTKITKLTDIGIQKSAKTDSTIALHPSAETSPAVTDVESEVDGPRAPHVTNLTPNGTMHRPKASNQLNEKTHSSPTRLPTPDIPRGKSPYDRTTESTTVTSKTVLSRYPAALNDAPKTTRIDVAKHGDVPGPEQAKVPNYQRPTKTSQVKEEKKEERTGEEIEVSTRRGSGKFGVELRRTSVEKTTMNMERRRSSTEHPCIEDIFDLDLLEQMLEKVVGYEQRRRIRAQIRVAKKKMESSDTYTFTKTKQTHLTKTRSPDRKTIHKSPERRKPIPQNTLSPERTPKTTTKKSELTEPNEPNKPLMNGHAKETDYLSGKRYRQQSPEKTKSSPKTRSTVRQPSPEKRSRLTSPSKIVVKPKSNRFNEYASAYMKKVGLADSEKLRTDEKILKTSDVKEHSKASTTNVEDTTNLKQFEEHTSVETKTMTMSKSYSERTSSKDKIEVVRMNGKRSPSPEKKHAKQQSPTERLYQRSPSPDFKRTRTERQETTTKSVHEKESPKGLQTETIIKTVYEEPKIETQKETIIKTVYDVAKKIPSKPAEDKPSWVTNRNLKKTSQETRSFSGRKVEVEKTPTRAQVARPTDVITSGYGLGPLDADGRPLFGIKALRNGASNYQVKGTVIRSEYHSRNGGEPEGEVSVTAYASDPAALERLLRDQGQPPSRIHGLAAITTTKRFGGDSGNTLREAHTKEDRAALEHFTHSDRRVETMRTQQSPPRVVEIRHSPPRVLEMRHSPPRVVEMKEGPKVEPADRKTVRQSSVKSLTEKYIKTASETSRSERSSATYPKAGLILRSTMKDSISSEDSTHGGLGRANSDHSLGSTEGTPPRDPPSRTHKPHPAPAKTTHQHTTRRQASPTKTTRVEHTTTRIRQTSPSKTTRSERSERSERTERVERSFLDSSTKVSGVQDILTRMKNADIVIKDGDTCEDAEARALLNKFLGATVLMAGMQGYVADGPGGGFTVKQETVRSSSAGGTKSTTKTTTTTTNSRRLQDVDLDNCWDEQVLRKLLEESTDYEQRRRVRARIRSLMAEQEACTSAVTAALEAAIPSEGGAENGGGSGDAREEEEVTVTSSERRDSSEKTVSSSTTTTTKTSKVIESMTRPAPKPVSPFTKFRQLEKQNSLNSPNSPKTPQSPGSPQAPYFKFTDPALHASALTIKERLLQWCRDKTRDYENVKLENFSTSWADGLAFCALIHHFLPDAFDYSQLTHEKRRHNFTLAFKIADEKAGIYPLLDVDDMVAMRKPDWKCVFTYVQAIHRRFKDQP